MMYFSNVTRHLRIGCPTRHESDSLPPRVLSQSIQLQVNLMAKSKSSKQLNETGRRNTKERRQTKSKVAAEASKPVVERRKKQRRRQIDPTTCERDYSELEVEFMQAMDEYKRSSGRMFPTCSEILEVLTHLGYRKVAEPQAIYEPQASGSEETESVEELI